MGFGAWGLGIWLIQRFTGLGLRVWEFRDLEI